MCPITTAMLGAGATTAMATMANAQFLMSALSIGGGAIGQARQQSALYEHQEPQAARQQQLASDAARGQYAGMQARLLQTKAAASLDLQNAQKEYNRTASTAIVQAAAKGTVGATVEEAQHSYAVKNEEFQAARMTQLSWEEDQIMSSLEAVRAQQAQRYEQAVGDPLAMPSPIAVIAQMGAAGMDAARFWGRGQK